MTNRYLIVDFEAYYDTKEMTLRKLTPPQYILDHRFESFGAAVAYGDTGPIHYYEHEAFKRLIATIVARGDRIAMVSHNALFDMCLLKWVYGYQPALMIDTMGMARALINHKLKWMSLEKVAEHLGLEAKGKFLANVAGKYWSQIVADGQADGLKKYAIQDAHLTRGIFMELRKSFPPSEYAVMDSVINCAVDPKFIVDQTVLAEHKHFIELDKEDLLTQAGLTGVRQKDGRLTCPELMSNEKFADLLRGLGIEPEMKISARTGQPAYAFAKSDQFMVDLDEHDDPLVQALAAARVGHKTTLEETRTNRFISIAQLDHTNAVPGTYPQGSFPIPLRYGAAHTHRLGGDWKLNSQNMPRQYIRDGVKSSGRLRTSLKAPPGYRVVTADAAQIEARVNAYICEEWGLVEDFRLKRDIYSTFAGEEIYHYPVDKKNNPNERFVGKQSILGLGFQMGGPKFQNTVKVQSRLQLGTTMLIELPEAISIVQAYRRRFANIAGAWGKLKDMLPALGSRNSGLMFGPVRFGHQEIIGPNGLKLYYHDLRQVYEDGQWKWKFWYAGKPKYIYGGKLLENIVQFLARIHIMTVGERVRARTGIRYAAQVHDELIYVVPDYLVGLLRQVLAEEMVRAPAWAPLLPLDYDLGEGDNYGEAK